MASEEAERTKEQTSASLREMDDATWFAFIRYFQGTLLQDQQFLMAVIVERAEKQAADRVATFPGLVAWTVPERVVAVLQALGLKLTT